MARPEEQPWRNESHAGRYQQIRGQYDGIAGFDDLIDFFARLACPDKQFAVMPGIAHSSFLEKNCLIAHILLAFFTQPEPVYTGE